MVCFNSGMHRTSLSYELALLNLKDCANLDQCICVYDFRPNGLELHKSWQTLRTERMEARAILRRFGYNVSHRELSEVNGADLNKYSAAVVQIYGAAIASNQKSSQDVILRGNWTINTISHVANTLPKDYILTWQVLGSNNSSYASSFYLQFISTKRSVEVRQEMHSCCCTAYTLLLFSFL